MKNIGHIHCVKRFRSGVLSSPCFSVFGLNAGKYGPEKLCIGHFSYSDRNIDPFKEYRFNKTMPFSNYVLYCIKNFLVLIYCNVLGIIHKWRPL